MRRTLVRDGRQALAPQKTIYPQPTKVQARRAPIFAPCFGYSYHAQHSRWRNLSLINKPHMPEQQFHGKARSHAGHAPSGLGGDYLGSGYPRPALIVANPCTAAHTRTRTGVGTGNHHRAGVLRASDIPNRRLKHALEYSASGGCVAHKSKCVWSSQYHPIHLLILFHLSHLSLISL